ncbi:glycosyltransferase family 2 protein [Methylosinus sp. LW4]|uniref:glycosyltransferase family 2 protein n=1 Tax=Methylosinus sp. LW4 TaxID=136993 RepID=UPI0012F7590F|nr:glycosyltransferase family 2 protein [Methylosinus sp. LW4]
MNSPLISIVIPAYNREKEIKRSLISVLNQTYSNIEVIVVDDNSHDNTIEEALSIGDKRIKIVRHSQNKGASAARNTGIKSAIGQLIAFQDTDDVWLPHKLKKQLAVLQANPESKFGFGPFIRVSQDRVKVFGHLCHADEKAIINSIVRTNQVSPQTVIADTAFMRQHGMFDCDFVRYEDWDLALRICRLTPIAYDPEPLAIVFETPGSLSSDILQDGIARLRIANKHLEKFDMHKAYLALNYAEAAHSFARSGKFVDAVDCGYSALQCSPITPGVWVRLLKASFRALRFSLSF